MLAVLGPGFGRPFMQFMKDFNRVAAMVSLIHDDNTGHIEVTPAGATAIHYAVTEKDQATIRRCMLAAGRIFFAAGAKQFILPTYAPTVVTREGDLERVVAGLALGPHTVKLISYHPQGTCRMGADPARSVVSPSGESHDVPGLWIADASLFPTSIMVNPQLSVYALAAYIAEKLHAELG
jgi:choline dehydrogenase-like flavoprotein